MPHIVKPREKAMLMKPKNAPAFADQAFISLMDKMKKSSGNKISLFHLIDDIIDRTLTEKWVADPFLGDFVNVKEVPYGRYNSDTNS